MEMEIVMEEGEDFMSENTTIENEEDISQLCRICANSNEYLIPIFRGEGLEHELKDKISIYLSIKVLETDKLPTQLCYQCASTLIAWHDLVSGCVEADKKLNALFQNMNPSESEAGVGERSKTVYLTENNTVRGSPSSASKRIETNIKSEEGITNHLMGSGNEDETEKIVVFEEEVTTMEPDIEEEVSSDLRPLSFKNFQNAISDLRGHLLRFNQINKRNPANKFLSNFEDLETSVPIKSNSLIASGEKGLALNIPNDTRQKEQQLKSKHTCISCNRLFTRAYDMKRHSLVHRKLEEPENNNGNGSLKYEMKQSVTTLRNSSVVNSCDICSRAFKSKGSLMRHKRIHTGERPYKCLECNKFFRSSSALGRHTKEVHAKVRSHHCNVCDKWFMNRATLEDHHRTHTGERPYICHQCGVMFKTKATLHHHTKTHTDSLPYKCVFCGRGFRRQHQLTAHISTHTQERAHVCDKCGRAFCRSGELRRHITTHTEDKPHLCLSCGASFSQQRYLKSHIKTRHAKSEYGQTYAVIPVNNMEFS